MKKQKELKGTIASRGVARGTARIVSSIKDFDKFQKGDILVAKLTDPSYVLIMSRAAGIITDLGGVTSHPAIIAREFNVPCIVGTKNATEVIKDGDSLELDANTGLARIL